MGGDGSTRWEWHSKARTVENCVSISTIISRRELANVRVLTPAEGSMQTSFGLDRARYGLFQIRADGEQPWMRVTYQSTSSNPQNTYPQTIVFAKTAPHLGGTHWWFICPDCKRRTAFLYLPPRASHFACRLCHHLTYRSSQECHPPDLIASLHRFYEQCDKLLASKKYTA
jgi:hypothetical protein